MTPPPGGRRKPGPDLDHLTADMRERLRSLDATLRDLATGEGAPPGFDLDRFLRPDAPRVRPLLVLLSAAAVSSAEGAAPPGDAATEHVAVAVELMDLAVAVHDRALGPEGGRRHRAARRLLGGAMGLLGANHLTLRALELSRLTPAPEIVGDLLEAMREAAAGHALGHGLHGQLPDGGQCLALAEAHNGAMFSFACRSGGRLGGAERTDITALGRYGRHTGIAWSLAEDLGVLEGDDVLAALDERAQLARPPYPVCLAAQHDPTVAQTWSRLRRRPDAARARDLAEQVRVTGALSEARRRLALEAWSARQAVHTLAPSAPRDALDRLAAALVS